MRTKTQIAIFLLAAFLSGAVTAGILMSQQEKANTKDCILTVYNHDGSKAVSFDGEAKNFHLEDGEEAIYDAKLEVEDGSGSISVYGVEGNLLGGDLGQMGDLLGDGVYTAEVKVR